MSTTGAAMTAITLSEDQLDPYVTHAPTRRRLTGPGLPGDCHLFTFEELCREGLRTVGDSTGDPGGRLTAELRDQLVIGALLDPRGAAGESVLLDGATGAVTTTSFLHDRPDLMDRRPLAPSLTTLVRFATAADELAGLRGQFASYAGRYGPKAAAEATRHLLALFEEGTDGEIPPFWKAAALIRPLALVPGPGAASGLALDLPARLLDREFGPGRMWRFEDVDFPSTLTHEPTRRFLRETGLPEGGTLLHLDTDVPLPTLAEHYAYQGPYGFDPARLPHRASHLIRLGHLVEGNSLVVDGETGEVLNWSEPDAVLFPLNTDVSTLAFTLWLLHRERAMGANLPGEPMSDAHDQLALAMIHTLSSIDPATMTTPPAHHYWTRAFLEEGCGVL
ncbi:SUKH-4 family immunity protein [Streptomyces sp. NPDC057616]|uniref:SUKH-4 family immunity protein n=1 Tax=Streptomyces sp. NPDC057616 TaxID=3346183 RepID=UPI0036899282